MTVRVPRRRNPTKRTERRVWTKPRRPPYRGDIKVPSLFDETMNIEYLKSVTDEDAEAQLREPSRWAYTVRDPTGAICCQGHGKSRRECEEWAVVNAAAADYLLDEW